MAPAFALQAHAQKEIITIDNWRVHAGDNPAWAKPELDDSQWTKVDFGEVNSLGLAAGTSWYRATFQAPAGFASEGLAVGVGPIDQVYDLYVNGVRVGGYGSWLPAPHAPFPRHMVFPLTPGLLKGTVGHIAIRRWKGGAGLEWVTFDSSGYMTGEHAPEIGSGDAIDALERLHSDAGRTAGGFITTCCARFYPDGRVVFANAGQIAPYVEGREVQLENGLPLGISSDAKYAETEITTDEAVTFVSDGVVEARDAKGELLGFDRMAALTKKRAEEVADAAQNWGQEDDITVLSVARVPKLEAVTA